MPGRVIDRNRKLAFARVVRLLSCTAVLVSILNSRPDHQSLPGTRSAIELIARASERGPSKLASIRLS